MQLIEKVQELQALKPPLDIDEINKRIKEWKASTNYQDPKAVETTTEVGKPKQLHDAGSGCGAGKQYRVRIGKWTFTASRK